MKMSDLMNDAYKDELLNLEPVDVDSDAIKNNVFEKLNLSTQTDQATQNNVTEIDAYITKSQERRKNVRAKPRRKTMRTVVIAVALVLVCSSAVYAASELLGMNKQDVDYFDKSGTGTTEVNSATYLGELEESVEEFNATVGESMTENGRTVTFDSVSVDDNFINGFFTITYDEPIDLNLNTDEFYPAYSKLRDIIPKFTIKVDGQYIEGAFTPLDQYDPYMEDDNTVKMMVRWALPTILPDTFALSVGTYSYFENYDSPEEGKYHFDVAIDKSAPAAYTRLAKSDSYTFGTTEGDKILELAKLAITPFGTILSAQSGWVETSDGAISVDTSKVDPGLLYITDDKGNIINALNATQINFGITTLELVGVASDAKSLTLAPVLFDELVPDADGMVTQFEGSGMKTYSVTDIGAKIELNKLGGFYLEDYKVEGCRVSLVLRPYGKCDYLTGGIVIKDENVSLAGGSHLGLQNEQLDRKTGLMTYSVDYYAATTEELKQITEFEVWYDNNGTIDEAAAITFPIEAIVK